MRKRMKSTLLHLFILSMYGNNVWDWWYSKKPHWRSFLCVKKAKESHWLKKKSNSFTMTTLNYKTLSTYILIKSNCYGREKMPHYSKIQHQHTYQNENRNKNINYPSGGNKHIAASKNKLCWNSNILGWNVKHETSLNGNEQDCIQCMHAKQSN